MGARDTGFLSIGDLLSIRHEDDGRVASEGFFDCTSFLSAEVHDRKRARQTVFRVQIHHSYKALTRLRRKLDKLGIHSIAEARASGPTGELRELLREYAIEHQRNEGEFEQVRGRAVRYGSVVQLQHESTLKYLIVSRKEAEHAAGRVLALDGDAGELSWFQLLPRLRVHSSGERSESSGAEPKGLKL